MQHIERAAIVGMGALGLLYADIITANLGPGHVAFLMDAQRHERHKNETYTINGRPVSFSTLPCEKAEPYDLVIVAVKYTGLQSALDVMAQAIGPQTIIISVMNGIISEEIIAKRFGGDHVLHAVAQGMDAMRFGSSLKYSRKGNLCIGMDSPAKRRQLDLLCDFLRRAGIEFVEEPDIRRRMWGKFMLNVGINQTCMVFGIGYGKALEKDGIEAMTLISAMREVIMLSRYEGVDLTEKDLADYVDLLKTLDPKATPSMGQDRLNKRPSEVELFAGTVRRLAAKHRLLVPANDFLYARVMEIEQEYS